MLAYVSQRAEIDRRKGKRRNDYQRYNMYYHDSFLSTKSKETDQNPLHAPLPQFTRFFPALTERAALALDIVRS